MRFALRQPIPAPPTMLFVVGLVVGWAISVLGCARPAVPTISQFALAGPADARDDDQKKSADRPPDEDARQPADDERPGRRGDREHPFPQRNRAPDFPKDAEWLNTSSPLKMRDLKGKFVLLDFWTYCCINCMHILPELKKLEHAYPNELVVIGVHSAKFETEQGTKNIEQAILRYEIEHPVVNDPDHEIWEAFHTQSWPTLVVIDPEGFVVARNGGEIKFEVLDAFVQRALPYYRENNLIDASPVRFALAAERQKDTPLRFPGKVRADEAGNRLFISDSNHNRIVITDLDGKFQAAIGSGAIGAKDGDYASATFHHPQGVALDGQLLYVADTENHKLRKVDLRKKTVATIAGTGEQARSGFPGLERGDEVRDRWVGKPKETELNSPWALWVHERDLYIAMAGPHQIWKMPLDESEIGPYAGNGREDIVDGPLLPDVPYSQGFASFAQPSGLASDGKWLYVADSEGSSIRAVPFDRKQEVKTVVGTSELPYGRLFRFGDRDGKRGNALLQHALGIVHENGKLFVADTYNNKIKVVDAETGETRTLAGTGKPGNSDSDPTFDEPAGVTFARGKLYVADTNNHAIRVVDPNNGKVETLALRDLKPPAPPKVDKKPAFKGATKVEVKPAKVQAADGQVRLAVKLELPKGWKINAEAPMSYHLDAEGKTGGVAREKLGTKKLARPAAEFEVLLPVSGTGKDQVQLGFDYFYCTVEEGGLCRKGSVVFDIPLELVESGPSEPIVLVHTVTVNGNNR